MSENMDDAKGRVKEAAGDLNRRQGLQREGKIDQAAGDARRSATPRQVKDTVTGDDDE